MSKYSPLLPQQMTNLWMFEVVILKMQPIYRQGKCLRIKSMYYSVRVGYRFNFNNIDSDSYRFPVSIPKF